jgi:hypothetical protein
MGAVARDSERRRIRRLRGGLNSRGGGRGITSRGDGQREAVAQARDRASFGRLRNGVGQRSGGVSGHGEGRHALRGGRCSSYGRQWAPGRLQSTGQRVAQVEDGGDSILVKNTAGIGGLYRGMSSRGAGLRIRLDFISTTNSNRDLVGLG